MAQKRQTRDRRSENRTMTEAPHPVHARPGRRLARHSWPSRPGTLLALLVFLLVAHALFGERGLSSALDTWRAHRLLTAQVSALRAENVRLRRVTERLRGDLATIEAVAREELGLIRPGETVFLLRNVQRSSDRALPATHR